jgi:hypothetical protein
MTEPKTNRRNSDAKNKARLRTLLNEDQRLVLADLERFGRELKFVRRPLFIDSRGLRCRPEDLGGARSRWHAEHLSRLRYPQRLSLPRWHQRPTPEERGASRSACHVNPPSPSSRPTSSRPTSIAIHLIAILLDMPAAIAGSYCFSNSDQRV